MEQEKNVNSILCLAFITTLQERNNRFNEIQSPMIGHAFEEILDHIPYSLGIISIPQSIKSEEELDFNLEVLKKYFQLLTTENMEKSIQ